MSNTYTSLLTSTVNEAKRFQTEVTKFLGELSVLRSAIARDFRNMADDEKLTDKGFEVRSQINDLDIAIEQARKTIDYFEEVEGSLLIAEGRQY